jgi:zinc finger protein
MEDVQEIPYFGKVYLFGMKCAGCTFAKSDVEAEQQKEPCKITFTIESEKDMHVRVVKSSEGSIYIPQLKMSVESGPNSDGYVSNIEGVIQRFEKIIEEQKEHVEDEDDKKEAKNLLKKLWKVKLGDIPLKIVIEDPSGNSAIISEKAVVENLKAKK